MDRDEELERQIDQARRFERWYDSYLRRSLRYAAESDTFNESDTRVLLELWFVEGLSGATIASRLALDPGHTCRVLKKLQAWDLVAPLASDDDHRIKSWSLTKFGERWTKRIEDEYRSRWRLALRILRAVDGGEAVKAMRRIEIALSMPAISEVLLGPP